MQQGRESVCVCSRFSVARALASFVFSLHLPSDWSGKEREA